MSSILNSEQKMIFRKIKSALNDVTESYWNDIQFMLTESDLVAKVFSLLDGELGKFQVHSEIRPFKKLSATKSRVIRKRNKDENNKKDVEYVWLKADRNTGTRFDLCVIDTECKFWKEAIEKAKGERNALRYWRLPSYPFKGIRAVIEFKVRVSGNIKRIGYDIQKLKKMCERNNQCLGFLVILDRCAPDRGITDIIDMIEGTGIHLFGLKPKPDSTSF